jgi:putative peptidoglycan lipid II flippase
MFKTLEVQRGAESAWAFAKSAPLDVGIVALALSGAGAAVAPLLALGVAGPFGPEEVGRVALYMRAGFGLVFLSALSSVLRGLLNGCGSLVVPSFETLVMNGVAVVALAALASRWGVFALVAALLAGGVAKVLLMLPSFARRRLPGKGPLVHPSMVEVARQAVPLVAASGLIALSMAVTRAIAARLQMEGALSHLAYAERIVAAPYDLFGTSIGVVLLPSLSHSVAAESLQEFRRRLTLGIRMATFAGLPSAVGLAVVAEPVVALLCEHGRFDPADTTATGQALRAYAGLLFFLGYPVLMQAAYALRRTGILLAASAAGLGANVALSLALAGPLRQTGLALAYSLGTGVSFGVALVLVGRRAGWPDFRAILGGAARAGACSAAMGGAVWALGAWTPVHVLVRVGAGVAFYVLLARFLCPAEWVEARRLWARGGAPTMPGTPRPAGTP